MAAHSREEHKRVLVIAERVEGSIASVTFELLQVGRMLADKRGALLCSTVIGDQIRGLEEEIAPFSDEVYCIDNPSLGPLPDSDLHVAALESLCKAISPDIILLAHTTDELEIATKLGYRLGSRLITDCVSIDVGDEGRLVCIKPVFGDRVFAAFAVDSEPTMASIRPKSIGQISNRSGKGTVIDFPVEVDSSLKKTELLKTITEKTVSLDKAEAVVAGGRVIKGEEGLMILESLAKALRPHFAAVEIAGSRPLIDAGLLPRSRQVGQTGEKVTPRIYLAVGISGASQHVSGIVGSKKIVAINKDAEALIFDVADYGVVGQYESVVPAIIEKLKELP